jgi:hypothetical protein
MAAEEAAILLQLVLIDGILTGTETWSLHGIIFFLFQNLLKVRNVLILLHATSGSPKSIHSCMG